MHHIVSVQPLENFRLEIAFDDGIHGTVALRDRLFGPVFEPLRDPEVFRQAFVDEFGVVCWPNGADLAPDTLYEQIRSGVAIEARE